MTMWTMIWGTTKLLKSHDCRSYHVTLIRKSSVTWSHSLIHDVNPSQLGEAQWCILPICGASHRSGACRRSTLREYARPANVTGWWKYYCIHSPFACSSLTCETSAPAAARKHMVRWSGSTTGTGDWVSTARLSSRAPESLLHAPRTSKMQLQHVIQLSQSED